MLKNPPPLATQRRGNSQQYVPSEALTKLEAMGYEPSLRIKETANGYVTCALLKVVELDDPTSPDNPFEDVIEHLQMTFDGAVRSPSGRPDGYLRNIGLDPETLSEIKVEECQPA
ncbi:MAG: hypothetical protein AB4290_29015 [Spirulina sp.]